ncbi:hypothetical protein EVAR_31322_1 [Eumeta japonica]|uniref:Uncharacterized protein n=1 Tax=Eumeta variegata TaxID=151549 RepID=A0A4C1Y0L2_EUMVA|nr:hypothetical protein EVAR_31322_1 [Eumeta japonica]
MDTRNLRRVKRVNRSLEKVFVPAHRSALQSLKITSHKRQTHNPPFFPTVRVYFILSIPGHPYTENVMNKLFFPSEVDFFSTSECHTQGCETMAVFSSSYINKMSGRDEGTGAVLGHPSAGVASQAAYNSPDPALRSI